MNTIYDFTYDLLHIRFMIDLHIRLLNNRYPKLARRSRVGHHWRTRARYRQPAQYRKARDRMAIVRWWGEVQDA